MHDCGPKNCANQVSRICFRLSRLERRLAPLFQVSINDGNLPASYRIRFGSANFAGDHCLNNPFVKLSALCYRLARLETSARLIATADPNTEGAAITRQFGLTSRSRAMTGCGGLKNFAVAVNALCGRLGRMERYYLAITNVN